MNLDSRVVYLEERKKLCKLSTGLLEKIVGQLYDEVYVQYNPERKEYHRMAVFVLNSRLKKSSLIFHLKNLVVR